MTTVEWIMQTPLNEIPPGTTIELKGQKYSARMFKMYLLDKERKANKYKHKPRRSPRLPKCTTR